MNRRERAGVVLWDFDGTLAFSKPLWSRAARLALDRHAPGHGADVDRLRELLRSGFLWHAPEIAHPELNEPESWWAHMADVFAGYFTTLGVPREAALNAARDIKDVVLDPASYTLAPGVPDALVTLSREGWQHAILSNHVPELEDLVVALGLRPHFSHVFTSGLVGYEKPHQAFYAHALAAVGARDDETVWMVGDNPDADIEGARRAGLPALLVGPLTIPEIAARVMASR